MIEVEIIGEEKRCDDCISRQAAIDALLKWMRPISINNKDVLESDDMVAVRNILKSLPSVQPEPCEDAVSRADVLECFADLYDTFEDCSKGIINELHRKFEDLRNLPSVTPKRKTGKWKKIGHWGRCYRCDQCGNILDFDGVNAGRGDANFCPNCGAEMNGGEQE